MRWVLSSHTWKKTAFCGFPTVGGIDPRVLFGRRVLIGEQKVPGVVAGAPVHLLDSEERAKAPTWTKLFFDIGADTREEAQRLVAIPDFAVWDTAFSPFGDRVRQGKKPWTTERAARCFWRCSRRTFPMT